MRLLALLLTLVPLIPAARAATVQVVVENVRNARGHIRVAICSRADFLHPHCRWQGHAPSRPGAVTVLVTGVPPGTYAAEAFQDENDDGRLERNIFGLPQEGMGFSNNARMYFGPPRFEAAAFKVPPEGTTIRFQLRYY